jgi:glucosamine-6-phosphate deaminase
MNINGNNVVLCDHADEVADHVANHFVDQLHKKPGSVLGLATGGTPVGVYQRWVTRHRDGQVSFAAATTFNLDEYVGLPADHPQSYRSFMRTMLFDHVDLPKSKSFIPDGDAVDLSVAANDHEMNIRRAGGIDLQLLGVGQNGHIAFNEPGSTRQTRTRVVSLTRSTIEANSRFFDRIEDVPTQAITMGIATILESKSIMVMAVGESKATAVHNAIQGPVTADCPASFLQGHPGVTWCLDRAAASRLKLSVRT